MFDSVSLQVVLPGNLQDLVQQLISNVVFLGVVSFALTSGIWILLAAYFNINVSENWKRLVSLVVPFLVAAAAYILGTWLGYQQPSPDAVYQVFAVAVQVALGKQVIYMGSQAVTSIKTSAMLKQTVPLHGEPLKPYPVLTPVIREILVPDNNVPPVAATNLPIQPPQAALEPRLPDPAITMPPPIAEAPASTTERHGGSDYASS